MRNIRLNRYNNVAPYDLHRVVLSQMDGTDYINASVANSSSEPEQIYLLGLFLILIFEMEFICRVEIFCTFFEE